MGEPTPPRSWPALTIGPRVAGDAAERLLLLLDDHPVTAIEETDAGPWRVFFQTADARDRALPLLRCARVDPPLAIDPCDVRDEDWARRTQEGLRAVTVGGIVVAPPWDVPAPQASAPSPQRPAPSPQRPIVIVIEPARGFGTGHHPSTRLALLALQRVNVTRRRVLDVGTGSGVLAIAAARLGAAEVVGLDRDPDSIDAARESVRRNGLEGIVELRVADVRMISGPCADVVLANLTGAFFARDGGALLSLLEPDGRLVAAGFTSEEEPIVRAGLAAAAVSDRLVEDDWVALVLHVAGRRQDAPPLASP